MNNQIAGLTIGMASLSELALIVGEIRACSKVSVQRMDGLLAV